ncbi:MAG: hypothetical protein ACRDT0_06180 [Pseudonocardiaceae bacterium]
MKAIEPLVATGRHLRPCLHPGLGQSRTQKIGVYIDAGGVLPGFTSYRPHLLVTGKVAYSITGIIGRPSAATSTKGKAVLDSLVAYGRRPSAATPGGRPDTPAAYGPPPIR